VPSKTMSDRTRLSGGGVIDELRVTYELHGPRLRALAAQYTAEDAEDVVQDAFVRALQHAARFRRDAKLSTWLYRIVVNECISRYRKRRRRERADRQWRRDERMSPNRMSADALDVRAALRSLSPPVYRALILHHVIGHTHDEIAAIMRIPVGTSKWRVNAARRRLRGTAC